MRVNFFIKLTQEIKKCRVHKEDTLYKKDQQDKIVIYTMKYIKK